MKKYILLAAVIVLFGCKKEVSVTHENAKTVFLKITTDNSDGTSTDSNVIIIR